MTHLRIVYALAAMLALVTLNTPALASEQHKAKLLEGLQETPAVITGATGSFILDIGKNDTSFDFELTYEGIEGGTVTQAHIHVGQPNVAGGIVIFLCTNLTPPVGVPVPPRCPTPSGTVTGTRTAADVQAQAAQGVSAGEFSAVLTAIRERATYANVHSATAPLGEIRGQIK